MRRQAIQFRLFKCPGCGFKISIPKAQSKMTSKGHIKDMWCPYCKEIKKFVQVKEGDDFAEKFGTRA